MMKAFAEYKSKGLEIVAYPCPQFGGQELSSDSAVKDFAEGKGFEVRGCEGAAERANEWKRIAGVPFAAGE